MLELYSNIKRLRKLHNMSQQELAEAVGYKGKSMIAQVENGKVDLSASMISKFAEVFNVSELDLMGLSENEIDDLDLYKERLSKYSIEEIIRALDFLDAFQKASPDARMMVESLLKSHRPGS